MKSAVIPVFATSISTASWYEPGLVRRESLLNRPLRGVEWGEVKGIVKPTGTEFVLISFPADEMPFRTPVEQ